MAAEIHIIGQIESAYGFGNNRVACRWSLHCGLFKEKNFSDREIQKKIFF